MQKRTQNNYKQFEDEADIPRGIPMGNIYNGQELPNLHYQQPIQPQIYYQNQGNVNTNQNYISRNQPQQVFNYPPPPPQIQIQPNYNYSLNMICTCCKCNVNTVVNPQYGNTAILWSALICCCFGQCCCVPFLWDNCLDKNHYCPNCGHNVLRKHQKCFDFIN